MVSETLARLRQRIRELEARLTEAEEAFRALREGQTDALAAGVPQSSRVSPWKGTSITARKLRDEELALLTEISRDFSRSLSEKIMRAVRKRSSDT